MSFQMSSYTALATDEARFVEELGNCPFYLYIEHIDYII